MAIRETYMRKHFLKKKRAGLKMVTGWVPVERVERIRQALAEKLGMELYDRDLVARALEHYEKCLGVAPAPADCGRTQASGQRPEVSGQQKPEGSKA